MNDIEPVLSPVRASLNSEGIEATKITSSKVFRNGNNGMSIIGKKYPYLATSSQIWKCSHAVYFLLGIMSKLRLSIFALVIFVLGVVAGGGAMIWGFNEFLFHSQSISRVRAEATIRISVLGALRENKTEKAVSFLEAMLDGDLIGLSVIPPSRLDDETIRVVQRASEYREKYPHSSNFPETDAHISAFLTRHRGNSSKNNN